MADNSNMRLWDRFKTTDPAHTKAVTFGRKFTSIDAHWQIQRMTEELGPIGEGWGYRTEHGIHDLSHCIEHLTMAWCDVTIWWKDGDGRREYGPIRGAVELTSKSASGKLVFDDDAPKKCMTDALTKGLSHLGVSADVFLGLFDDNKYVQRVQQKFGAERTAAEGLPESVRIMERKINETATPEALEELWKVNLPALRMMAKPHVDYLALRAKEQRGRINEALAKADD
jgi:hypothetical protein